MHLSKIFTQRDGRNLQLDDCSWGMVVDPSAPVLFGTTKAGLEKIKEQLLDVNNKAIEGAPKDLVINTHVCRGNFHSTYASSGAYDSVAETLFAKENVNAYYLEFDVNVLVVLNVYRMYQVIKK